MNYDDKEKFVKDLDKILQDKAEKGFKQRLTSFFNSLVDLSIYNIPRLVNDILAGKNIIKDLFNKQKKLKDIFNDYTKKTSRVTDQVTKKELKKVSEDLLKRKTLIDKSKVVEVPKETIDKRLKEGLTNDQKQKDIKAKKEKIKADIKKIIKEKPSLLNNSEKSYNNSLAVKEIADFQKDIRSKIIEYMQENPTATVRQVKDAIKGASKAFIDRRIEVIARTEGTKISNRRRLEQFSKSTIIQGVEFLAVMDNRTTIHICVPRHRKQFKLNSAELAMNTPPLHFNCRSILSPITIYEDFTPIEVEDFKKLPPVQKGFNTP